MGVMATIMPRPKLLCSTISPFWNFGGSAFAVFGVMMGRTGGRTGPERAGR